LSIAHGAFTVIVGFLPKDSGRTLIASRLSDGLMVELGEALGDADGDAEGEASDGEVDGVADWLQAARASSAAEQAATSAVLITADGTPRL